MRLNLKKLIFATFLIIFGGAGRMLLLGLPNVETLTISALLAGSMLGGMYSVLVPLGIVVLTDVLIGNNSILFFTWSAWIVIGTFGLAARKNKKTKINFVIKMTGLGLASSLFFYIYTNFGVWLLWPLYTHDISGLIQCYLMGLPFLRMSIIGNLIIVPAVSFAAMFCLKNKYYFSKILSYVSRKICRKRLEERLEG